MFEEKIEIPLKVWTLAEFRRWALSDEFPQQGRIDFIRGRIEVDMSPEDIFCHSTPKSEIHGVLYSLVKARDLGHLLVDRVFSGPKPPSARTPTATTRPPRRESGNPSDSRG